MLKTEKPTGLEINMVDIVNKEIKIRFELSVPQTKILRDFEIQKIRANFDFDVSEGFSNLSRLNLEFLARIIKINCEASVVNNWNEKIFDFKRRQYLGLWKILFQENALILRHLFAVLFLKFKYVSMCHNPSILACEAILNVFRQVTQNAKL